MRPSAEIDIGYGVDAAGRGVAYARTSSSVLRLPFRIAQRPLLLDRAGGYAALGTVARALQKRGIGRARFRLHDRQMVDELTKRSQPPNELSLANVRALRAQRTGTMRDRVRRVQRAHAAGARRG